MADYRRLPDIIADVVDPVAETITIVFANENFYLERCDLQREAQPMDYFQHFQGYVTPHYRAWNGQNVTFRS